MINRYKELAEDLIDAKDYKDFIKSIDKYPELKDDNNWVAIGDNENNSGIIENQASNGVDAIIEKITNSIDAKLVKECLKLGINPESDDAPKDMKDARLKFFNVKDPNDSNEWLKIADDIAVIMDGSMQYPTISVVDDGEGQYPKDFPKTFMSLNKGGKRGKVKFAHGRYGMGSHGTLSMCLDDNHDMTGYQFILSKRNNEIFKIENKSDKNLFGMTITRVNIKDSGATWEYFAPNNKIIEIDAKEFTIPVVKVERKPFTSGTLVKMFNFDLGVGKQTANIGAKNALNSKLFSPILPYIIIENRFGYHATANPRVRLDGHKVKLDSPTLKNKDGLSINIDRSYHNVDLGGTKGQIDIQIFTTEEIFKGDNFGSAIFTKGRPMIFTVKGQVQGSVTYNEFFGKKLKLKNLNNRIFLVVDCDKLSTSTYHNFFKASRDRFDTGTVWTLIQEKIIEFVKEDGKLKALDEKIRRKQMSGGSGEASKDIQNLIKYLENKVNLHDLPVLKNDYFFNSNKKNKESDRCNKDEFKNCKKSVSLERFPSYFEINLKEKDGRKVKSIPIDSSGSISFNTDVNEDYLIRDQDPGEIQVALMSRAPKDRHGIDPVDPSYDLVEEIFSITKSISKGQIKINFKPNEKKACLGEEVEIKVSLKNKNYNGFDFSHILFIKIVEENDHKKPKERKKKPNDIISNLPDFKEYSKDEFLEKYGSEGFDESDTVFIVTDDNDRIEFIGINTESRPIIKALSHKTVFPDAEMIEGEKTKLIRKFIFGSIVELETAKDLIKNGHITIEDQPERYASKSFNNRIKLGELEIEHANRIQSSY